MPKFPPANDTNPLAKPYSRAIIRFVRQPISEPTSFQVVTVIQQSSRTGVPYSPTVQLTEGVGSCQGARRSAPSPDEKPASSKATRKTSGRRAETDLETPKLGNPEPPLASSPPDKPDNRLTTPHPVPTEATPSQQNHPSAAGAGREPIPSRRPINVSTPHPAKP